MGSAKIQGLLINGHGPISWWERGKTAPVLRESLAASPQGINDAVFLKDVWYFHIISFVDHKRFYGLNLFEFCNFIGVEFEQPETFLQ